MNSHTRVAAGVPTGGQFAASAKTESDVALAPSSTGTEPEPVGPDASPLHLEIDRLVTQWQDRTQCADIVNATSYEGSGDYEPSQAAYVLLQHTSDYDNGDGYTASVFDADGNEIGWVSPPGGEFHAREVPAEFRPDDGAIDHDDADLCLDVAKVRAFDWASAERDYLTGLAAAVTPRTAKSEWPETDFERLVLPDWKYEVANDDEPSGFRDWFENRYGKRNQTKDS